ncbi:hypothetical protein BLA29_014179 [Euroglyphus maynei]|uniref:Uncharacterized protein n=1 Tax=Euroglyphus maynei TaxID=6958 RepID=A0A1Y3B0S5_EURMA|nr:hypothetical protein BLA29_014179 [Euroglyphus maynei]
MMDLNKRPKLLIFVIILKPKSQN